MDVTCYCAKEEGRGREECCSISLLTYLMVSSRLLRQPFIDKFQGLLVVLDFDGIPYLGILAVSGSHKLVHVGRDEPVCDSCLLIMRLLY